MKKHLSVLIFALSLLAAACGSDTPVVAQEPAEPTAEPTAAAADEPPPETLGAGPYPIGTVQFVVSNGQPDGEILTYSLSCLGDTATLSGNWAPADQGGLGSVEDRMCRQLGTPKVQTRLIDGLPADLACPQVYGSADTATVTGQLNGSPVSTTFDRVNGCGIGDWDGLMAGLLPLPTNEF